MLSLPELVLLELRFKTLLPINNLPHYHGGQWSAMFRSILKPYLSEKQNLSSMNFWVHPVETGILSYDADEPVHIGITFPAGQAQAVGRMLTDFNSIDSTQGHFQPGKTIRLDSVLCRKTKKPWDYHNTEFLDVRSIEEEIQFLQGLDAFTLLIHSPMRHTRPEGYKTKGHHYCDGEFFFDVKNSHAGIVCFLSGIKNRANMICSSKPSSFDEYESPITPSCGLTISGGALTWLDMFYSKEPSKTIGGIVGKILIKGRPSFDEAWLFVLGQYTGIGKNPVFGFGFYTIPELDNARKISGLSRGKDLFERAFTPSSLASSLAKLPNSSPGADMITVEDLRKAGEKYLEKLRSSLLNGTYEQGSLKKYRLPKEEGAYREIHIQNVCDRLVHKAVADCLFPVIDGLLSNSSYAYRRGLNRKGAASALKNAIAEGYTKGIKADIFSFFDSINIEKLTDVLEGLLPFEPLVHKIREWLECFASFGIKGIPQGSPLSPVLSNLYLDRFDRDMALQGFRLIRYSDDFVILTKDDITTDEIRQRIGRSLAKLDLCLKEQKTVEVNRNTPIRFLGYLVTEGDLSVPVKEDVSAVDDDHEWSPVFKDQWLTGQPVYLTTLCRGAYSNGPHLVIKSENDSAENISWNQISRLIIVGRSQFSGGVVYRAVKEEIPVTFIDVLGRARGTLHPEYREMPDVISLQEQYAKDPDFSLSFAREIVAAKIHNSVVLLRRNSTDTTGMREMEQSARNASSLDSLRGYEGNAAKVYFNKFAGLVVPFDFAGRIYHPPEGPVNVMLSLGYTMLYNRIAMVLRDKGFNARLGFYHKSRGMHSALASDLLEELRHIVERVVLSLIHLGEIKKTDFVVSKGKGLTFTRLAGEGFRTFIRRFEKTMALKASYSGGEKMSYNTYLDEMADNLKRTLKLGIPYKALRIE